MSNNAPTPLTAFRWDQPIGAWRARGAHAAALRTGLGLPCPALRGAPPKDNQGFTLWHYWANSPRPHESFAQLHERMGNTQADDVSTQGFHPWHFLLHHGHTRALAAWSKAMGAPSTEPKPSSTGDTLAHAAAWSGNKDCLDHLSHLDMEHINHADDKGFTPLIIAIHRGGRELTQAFLLAGADPDAADAQGRTAMHHVALYGDVGLLGLLEDMGGDADLADGAGLSANSIVRTRRNATAQDLEGIRLYWEKMHAERLVF